MIKSKWKFLVLLFILLLTSSSQAEIKLIAAQNGGFLLESEKSRVLLLQGTPYQMGYQHGVLLRKEVKEIVDKVLAISFSEKPGWIEKAYEKTKEFIPTRYTEEMRGLAEDAGIPLEKIVQANLFPELFHCTGAVFFGKATKDREFFHIRILDYMTEANLQKNSVVMVYRPYSRVILYPGGHDDIKYRAEEILEVMDDFFSSWR
ncbi:MAG TPA: hypothetical protein EYP78_04425 [Candidatus Omnitrophica bacterium]|nr:hypothetical protein [Candidatus Omnitrophota bacterium]